MEALLKGSYSKIQKIYLPGDLTKSVKITAATTVSGVVKDLCEQMGEVAVGEYGLYIHTSYSEPGSILRDDDYLLDTTTILERNLVLSRIYFQRILWFTATKPSTPMHVTLLFEQIMPDIYSGVMIRRGQMTEDWCRKDFCRLLVFKHIAIDSRPSFAALLKVYQSYMQEDFFKLLTLSEWEGALKGAWDRVREGLSPLHAREQYLAMASSLEMYGSTFFSLEEVADDRIPNGSLLRIFRDGIQFLDRVTRGTILTFSYKDVISTRRLGKKVEGKHYIDLKLGNLMVQRVIRCETKQAGEISNIIAHYLESHVDLQRIKDKDN
jgi:myosin-15